MTNKILLAIVVVVALVSSVLAVGANAQNNNNNQNQNQNQNPCHLRNDCAAPIEYFTSVEVPLREELNNPFGFGPPPINILDGAVDFSDFITFLNDGTPGTSAPRQEALPSAIEVMIPQHLLNRNDLDDDLFLENDVTPGDSESVQQSPGAAIRSAPSCELSSTVLCLNDGRFRAEITWKSFEGNSGPGMVVQNQTDTSGLFYFFDPDNWDMLVKVLDGCDDNNHFWVFAAATTNVKFEMTVTDTQANQTKVYTNELGTPFEPIQDTEAFTTCP